jgi:hypothetical protein
MLPDTSMALDEEGAQDRYAPDNITTATHHSSPISSVRTPPDFPAAAHMQHHQQQFGKKLDSAGAAVCFDLYSAGEVLAYHAGFEIAQDPFGLDASLFSI